MAQRLTILLVLIVSHAIASFAATATTSTSTQCATACGSDHTPNINPCWKWGPDFCPQDVEPKIYTDDPDRDQTYACEDPRYDGQTFNLAEKINCGTQLSGDLYGWGVRVGFYTNWIASVFANVFVCDEIVSTVDANAIFLLALEVAALKITASAGQAMRVDALIFYLVGIGTAVGSLSLWGRRTKFYHLEDIQGNEKAAKLKLEFGGVGTYSRLLLSLAVGLYGLWFWYSPFRFGILVNGSCDPRCGTAFIFGSQLQRGIRWLFFTFTVLCVLYWAILLLLLIICLVPGQRIRWRKLSTSMHDSFLRLSHRLPLARLVSKHFGNLLPICNFLWYVFVIILIEVTLHQNRALDTFASAPTSSSPAQLISLLIGAGTLSRLIWVYFTEGYKELGFFRQLRPFVADEIGAQTDASELDHLSARKTTSW